MTVIPDNASSLVMYHVGLVVPNLDEAVARYSGAFGLRFAGRREIPLNVRVDGEPREVELHATYSKDGPPYLELIEEKSGATWASDAFGMNHMGFWAKDVASGIARLETEGFPARVVLGDTPPRISYHQGPDGLWIELVGPASRASLDSWLATSYT